jgi:hypothetical protein
MAKAHEPGHVNVASVHDVKTASLQAKMVQKGGIVHTRTCDLDESGNVASKVEQCVRLDTRTALVSGAQSNKLRHKSMVVESIAYTP